MNRIDRMRKGLRRKPDFCRGGNGNAEAKDLHEDSEGTEKTEQRNSMTYAPRHPIAVGPSGRSHSRGARLRVAGIEEPLRREKVPDLLQRTPRLRSRGQYSSSPVIRVSPVGIQRDN